MKNASADAPRKILVIDDEPALIDLIARTLENREFEVLGAGDGASGLTMIEQEPPDLVLLDLMLPGMHGWDVYQKMKDSDAMKDIPVIVVTAKSQSIDKVFGEHIAKVDAYITKPFSPDDLLSAINAVL